MSNIFFGLYQSIIFVVRTYFFHAFPFAGQCIVITFSVRPRTELHAPISHNYVNNECTPMNHVFFFIQIQIEVQIIGIWNSFTLSYLLVYKLQKYLPKPCKSVKVCGSLYSVECGSVNPYTNPRHYSADIFLGINESRPQVCICELLCINERQTLQCLSNNLTEIWAAFRE